MSLTSMFVSLSFPSDDVWAPAITRTVESSPEGNKYRAVRSILALLAKAHQTMQTLLIEKLTQKLRQT